MSGVEQALAMARAQRAPVMSEAAIDAAIGLAVRQAAREPLAVPGRRSAMPIAFAVAGIAAAFALGWGLRGAPESDGAAETARPAPEPSVEPSPAPAPGVRLSEITLPTGDVLHASEGADWAVRALETERRLAVDAGAVLFDVAPREGERFVVRTPHGQVEVLGTIFSVTVEGGRTVVRVYEGRVLVRFGDTFRILGAREAISVAEHGWSVEPAPGRVDAAMERIAFAASARRASLARPVPVASPVADGPSAPVPELAAEPVASDPMYGDSIPRPSFARRWIADGQPARARAVAHRAIADGYHAPTWRMVEGDALLALDAPVEAERAYALAAQGYGDALAARAAHRAAQVRLDHLGDPEGAVRLIDRYMADAEPEVGSRLVALRARAMRAQGAGSQLGVPR